MAIKVENNTNKSHTINPYLRIAQNAEDVKRQLPIGAMI